MIRKLLFIWGVSATTILFAQAPDSESDQTLFREVAGDLRCPTCTGLSVLDSDAPFSVQIKNEVQEQLKSGRSKDEVLKFFVERYGPWILRVPPVSGVNALAWLVPIAFLIGGPLLIWWFVARKTISLQDDAVRPMEVIVVEMRQRLDAMRKSSGEM